MSDHKYIQSIASQSLGRAWHHGLDKKLAACARHGFQAIEVFMEDLEYVARSLPDTFPAARAGTSFDESSDWDEQRLAAADYTRHLCSIHALSVICLQPFMHYDGLIDRQRHGERIQELHTWILIAQRLGTDLIQVPSSFLPEAQCTSDRDVIVADLQEIADIGLRQLPPIRFAYEALCWGTHVNKWDEAWDIVEAVDRPNFGTCLDTFNIAGRIYADPTAPSGKTPSARRDFKESMLTMKRKLDISKVFYVECCDGEQLDQPLNADHPWYNEDQPTRMSWSRNARLFPFERKGYMPVIEILETILDLGYEGFIAFELFSRTANMPDASVPEDHARRGQESWVKMMRHLDERSSKQHVSQTRSRVGHHSEGLSQQSLPRL